MGNCSIYILAPHIFAGVIRPGELFRNARKGRKHGRLLQVKQPGVPQAGPGQERLFVPQHSPPQPRALAHRLPALLDRGTHGMLTSAQLSGASLVGWSSFEPSLFVSSPLWKHRSIYIQTKNQEDPAQILPGCSSYVTNPRTPATGSLRHMASLDDDRQSLQVGVHGVQ